MKRFAILSMWLCVASHARFFNFCIGGNAFPAGNFAGVSTGNTASVYFTGTNPATGSGLTGNLPILPNTGFDATTSNAGTFLEFYAGGRFLMDIGILGSGTSGRGIMSLAMDLIPDGISGGSIGLATHPWPYMFTSNPIAITSGLSARQVVIKPGGYGGAVVGLGYDMTDDYGAAYFRFYDSVTQQPVDNVWSAKSVNKIVTEKLGDAVTGSTAGYSGVLKPNTTVDGAAGSHTLEGGSASGSGAGGNAIVQGGTSGSGTAGVAQIGRTSTTDQNILNNATSAAANCGSIPGAAGCLRMTINGTTRYVPYF